MTKKRGASTELMVAAPPTPQHTWEELIITHFGKIHGQGVGYKGLMNGVVQHIALTEPLPEGLLSDTMERMHQAGTLPVQESKQFGYYLKLNLPDEDSQTA